MTIPNNEIAVGNAQNDTRPPGPLQVGTNELSDVATPPNKSGPFKFQMTMPRLVVVPQSRTTLITASVLTLDKIADRLGTAKSTVE
ncbi:MAG: hypothetical protein AAGB04_21565 [Pseudomonadota bacterium]